LFLNIFIAFIFLARDLKYLKNKNEKRIANCLIERKEKVMATYQTTQTSSLLAHGLLAASQTYPCPRCGGLFIKESLFDLYDETGQMRRWALRCVQCGDVVDSLILKNRACEELPNPKPEHRRRWAKMQSVSN
jgi:predicted RNA-binding Zn-ribbon protein involved in translation (DUF1610 family)